MRLVPVLMLQPSMELAQSIYHNDCLILEKGKQNIGKYAERLRSMGIDYVYVEDEKSYGIEIPDAISERTREQLRKALSHTIENFIKNSTLDTAYILETVDSVVSEILENEEVQISLEHISATDEYTLSHSVSTTVYALVLGKQLKYSKSLLKELGIGTILHDIGKVMLDKRVLFKEGPLTEEEFDYVKTHAILGYNSLKDSKSITELSKMIVLYHHERMDGSGYPTGVKAKELPEMIRVVAIADVYDALTSKRCYRERWSNLDAVKHLLENSDIQFDANLVGLFIKEIAVYPNGSMVKLSDGTSAIVKEQNKDMPLRPVVRVISDQWGQDVPAYEIDLCKKLSITITENEAAKEEPD